ncbi:MAG: DsbA family oxidoreductase [Bacteroidia bacterium]
MKVEIWSDVMCPFCYIGKRKFELALEQVATREQVEIEWKSFELNPDLKTAPSKSLFTHLSESKGWTMEQTQETCAYVTNMAAEVGLKFQFDTAVVANSRMAHRLSHLAKIKGVQNMLEELLFRAYFTESKNTDDIETLVALGKEAGLEENEMRAVLNSDQFLDDVLNDEREAQQLGIRGVPYFVFDRKLAVSGAQAPSVFLKALEQAFQAKPVVLNTNGEACDVDGNCN